MSHIPAYKEVYSKLKEELKEMACQYENGISVWNISEKFVFYMG